MYTLDVPGFDGALETALEYARKGVFLEPDLGARAGELMRRALKIDPLVDDLVEGLYLAGMPARQPRIS